MADDDFSTDVHLQATYTVLVILKYKLQTFTQTGITNKFSSQLPLSTLIQFPIAVSHGMVSNNYIIFSYISSDI